MPDTSHHLVPGFPAGPRCHHALCRQLAGEGEGREQQPGAADQEHALQVVGSERQAIRRRYLQLSLRCRRLRREGTL